MYELEKTFFFEAGHLLAHHDGKCSIPHGHSYVVSIKIRGNQLIQDGPKRSMLADFGDIAAVVNPMIENYLDHHWLNDSLQTDSPTAEFIATWVYNYLEPHLPGLYAVTLQETHSSKVTYSKSPLSPL